MSSGRSPISQLWARSISCSCDAWRSIPGDVENNHVEAFDLLHVVAADDDAFFSCGSEPAALIAGQSDRVRAPPVGRLDRVDYIHRVAAAADADHQVARLGPALHLRGEDV